MVSTATRKPDKWEWEFLIPLLNRFVYWLNSLNKTLKNTVKWKTNLGKVWEICQ